MKESKIVALAVDEAEDSVLLTCVSKRGLNIAVTVTVTVTVRKESLYGILSGLKTKGSSGEIFKKTVTRVS